MSEEEKVLLVGIERKEEEEFRVNNVDYKLIDSITINKSENNDKDWFLRSPSSPCLCFEELRWKISLCGLYNPFNCCINSKKFNFIPRTTISDIFFILFFLCWMIIPLLIGMNESTKDITSKHERLRYIAIGFGELTERNLILTLVLTQRNSIPLIIFGLPFERAAIYHDYISKLSLLCVWTHFILWMVYWSGKKDITIGEELVSSPAIYGFIALICFQIGAFIAYSDNRRKCFEIFMKSHWILMSLFVIFIMIHFPFRGKMLFLPVIILQIIDVIIRLYLSFGKPATIKSIEYLDDNDIVKIIWNKKDFTFYGGQYVFICIPSISLSEWHPFSLSCPPNLDDNNGDFSIHIKCNGDYVEKLKYLVKDMHIKKMKIYIEGPYGRPAIPIFKYTSIVLMCGGIGVTPMISIFGALIDNIKRLNVSIITKRIHFVWTVKTPQIINEFDKIIKKMVKKYSKYENNTEIKLAEEFNLNGIVIKISYYVTRIDDDDKEKKEKWSKIYPNLYFKRPSPQIVIVDAQQSVGNQCIGIMGCGPMGMIESIRNEAAYHQIHCHTEVFNI